MKKYNIDNLRVVKIQTKNEVRYTICYFNRFFRTYTDVFTEQKVVPTSPVEALTTYYNCVELYHRRGNGKLYITKGELLEKYTKINELKKQEQSQLQQKESKSKQEPPMENIAVNKLLEIVSQNFFPKTGEWWSNCFERSTKLYMSNLPCNLRNPEWLAHMLIKQANLNRINYYDVLDFVNNSKVFEELRHNYELEIVKWQIEWIKNGGEGWICDDDLGGDFTLLSPVCDLGFRKGVVDTLSAIGMNQEVIEEGLEKYADMWRPSFISRAFFSKYGCVFFLADPNVPRPEIDKEHEAAWIKYRKYEYYHTHKKMVDKYGTPDEDMLMSPDEAIRLKYYLDVKDKERKQEIENYKKEAFGTGRTHSLWG